MDIQVQRMYRFESDRPLKAFVDVVVDSVLLIKGIRILDSKNGLFVSMPSEKACNGKYYDTVRCLTKEVADQISEVCLSAYKEE